MFHTKFDKDIWFVADLHENHRNLCRGTSLWQRGWRDYNTLEKMNQDIWNSLILPKDSTLFILGDIIFGDKNRLFDLMAHIRQTCSKVYLIYGNHDDHIRKDQAKIDLFDWAGDYTEIFVGKRMCVLSHYPLYAWRDSSRGSFHLFGHEHQNINHTAYAQRRCLDVGWDRLKRPIQFSEIENILLPRSYSGNGHHSV